MLQKCIVPLVLSDVRAWCQDTTEHDYRELKTGLGLAHYEGRKWAGWHHHVTLVAAAHGFLTLQRLDPKAPVPE